MTTPDSQAARVISLLPLADLADTTTWLLNQPDHRPAAIGNPHLPEQVVVDLLQGTVGPGKLPADEYEQLAWRADHYGSDVVDAFIDTVTSVRALTQLVHRGQLTSDQLDRLATAGSHVKGKLAAALLQAGASPQALLPAARRSGQEVMLIWLDRYGADHDPDEVAEIIAESDQWLTKPISGMGDRLKRILRHGGVLQQAAIDSGHRVVQSIAAGMPALTEAQAWQVAGVHPTPLGHRLDEDLDVADHSYVWLGLVNNPVCPQAVLDALTEAFQHTVRDVYKAADSLAQRLRYKPAPVTQPYGQVSDPEQVSWLVRRAASREHTLLQLIGNPHLTDEDFEDLLVRALRSQSPLATELTTAARRAFLARAEDATDATEEFQARLQQAAEDRIPRVSRRTDSAPQPHPGLDEDEIDVALSRSFAELRWAGEPVLRDAAFALAARLGDDPQRWATLLSLAGDHDGPLLELTEIVAALRPTPA